MVDSVFDRSVGFASGLISDFDWSACVEAPLDSQMVGALLGNRCMVSVLKICFEPLAFLFWFVVLSKRRLLELPRLPFRQILGLLLSGCFLVFRSLYARLFLGRSESYMLPCLL